MPCRRSRSGSVSSSVSSITTRAGQWNAPTRFLPSGMSIAVLPPIAASTWPTSVVGTGDPRHAAQVRRGGEPRDVGRAAAAERDERAVAVEPQLAPEPPQDADRLRLLAGRQLVRRREPVAERLLRARPVDAHHVRVGDERDRAVAGHELAQQVERAALVVDAAGGEDRALDVGRRPRRRPRGRAAAAPRRGGGTRPRPARAAGSSGARAPRPSSTSTSTQQRERAAGAPRGSRGVVTAPPPSAITAGSGAASAARTACASISRKPLLAALLEELRDRLAGALLDRLRRGRGTRGRAARQLAAERRLAGAHEPDRARRGPRSERARSATRSDALEVGAPGGHEVADRVAAELLVRRARELPRDRGLGHDRERLDRGDVGALDERLAPPRRSRGRPSASGFISVGSGFIAARTTISSPFEMPASIPPAWFVCRRRSVSISSCASRAELPASAKPSPISTPFTAWMPITAAASRASSRSSLAAYEPRPGGTLRARTSIDAADRVARRARLVDRARGAPPRRRPSSRPRSPIVPSSAFATPPAATCTAVCRADARSSALRTSSWSYLSTPARSAWPGRGSVTVFVPLPCGSPSGGHGLMPHVQFLWSLLRTTSASGVPSVRPWRSPASTSTRSCSICCRGERP